MSAAQPAGEPRFVLLDQDGRFVGASDEFLETPTTDPIEIVRQFDADIGNPGRDYLKTYVLPKNPPQGYFVCVAGRNPAVIAFVQVLQEGTHRNHVPLESIKESLCHE